MYEYVAEYLRTRRAVRGETQDAVGRAVGVAASTIGNIEHGRQRVRLHTFLRMCQFLGTDPADILTCMTEEIQTVKENLT